jgi:hypothetical protein
VRSFIAQAGSPAYRRRQERWSNHVAWMRSALLGGRARAFGKGRRESNHVTCCALIARNALAERQLACPPPRELRHLVRLVLRYARRGRIAFNDADLANNTKRTRRFLADFISARYKAAARSADRK